MTPIYVPIKDAKTVVLIFLTGCLYGMTYGAYHNYLWFVLSSLITAVFWGLFLGKILTEERNSKNKKER